MTAALCNLNVIGYRWTSRHGVRRVASTDTRTYEVGARNFQSDDDLETKSFALDKDTWGADDRSITTN